MIAAYISKNDELTLVLFSKVVLTNPKRPILEITKYGRSSFALLPILFLTDASTPPCCALPILLVSRVI
jgi:hypothetical protein